MALKPTSRQARRAFLARGRIIKLLASAQGKLVMLDQLLREYVHEQVLIFTENNSVAYTIARRHLIPVITHETKAEERKFILDAFQDGAYQAMFRRALKAMETEELGGACPSLVAQLVERLVTAPSPARRHTVGAALERMMPWIRAVLPTRLYEHLLMKHYVGGANE